MTESFGGKRPRIESDALAAAYKKYAADIAAGTNKLDTTAYELMRDWWLQQLEEVNGGRKTLAEAQLEKMTILAEAGFTEPLALYDDIQEAREYAREVPKDANHATLRNSYANVIKSLRQQARIAKEKMGVPDETLKEKLSQYAQEFSPSPSVNFVRRVTGENTIFVDVSWRFKDYSQYEKPYLEDSFDVLTKFDALRAAKAEGMDDPLLDLLNRFKEFLASKNFENVRIRDIHSVSDTPFAEDQEGAAFVSLTATLKE